jgi:hypothetical protein
VNATITTQNYYCYSMCAHYYSQTLVPRTRMGRIPWMVRTVESPVNFPYISK